jgi:hypothetical protein
LVADKSLDIPKLDSPHSGESTQALLGGSADQCRQTISQARFYLPVAGHRPQLRDFAVLRINPMRRRPLNTTPVEAQLQRPKQSGHSAELQEQVVLYKTKPLVLTSFSEPEDKL